MASVFEIAVYNERVRRLKTEGGHDQYLSDIWSNTNYFFVTAEDETEAVEKLRLRLPDDADFVVDEIKPHPDYVWNGE